MRGELLAVKVLNDKFNLSSHDYIKTRAGKLLNLQVSVRES